MYIVCQLLCPSRAYQIASRLKASLCLPSVAKDPYGPSGDLIPVVHSYQLTIFPSTTLAMTQLLTDDVVL